MSVIKCPECGTQVSTLAEQCPGCGVRICNNLERCASCGSLYIKSQGACPYCGEEPQELLAVEKEEAPAAPVSAKPKPKGRFLSCLLRLALLPLLAAGGYFGFGAYRDYQARQEEERRFRDLAPLTNPDFYRQYLADYPLSSHRAEVQARLLSIEGQQRAWDQALQAGTREALALFLATYPDAVQAPKCVQLIDSADWAEAQLSSLPGAVQAYLDKHPEGIYSAQAIALQKKILGQRTTPAEQEAITHRIGQLCQALSSRDAKALQALVAEPLHSVQGKPKARVADVLAFVQGRDSGAVKAVAYEPQPPHSILRDKLPDNTTGFRATLDIIETRTSAKPLPATRFSALILFDGSLRIVSLELSK